MYQCFFTTLAEPAYGDVGGTQVPASYAAGAEPSARPDSTARRGAEAAPAEARDFDFLHGQWLVENRSLAEPLGASSGGVVFDSVHSCRPLPIGGHLEEAASEEGAAGVSLRLFDARSRRWTVYRIEQGQSTLAAPLSGGFENGVGTFIGETLLRGRPVLVRETWTLGMKKPRCEHAFSWDGGRTWSTHSIRDFIRVDWPQ